MYKFYSFSGVHEQKKPTAVRRQYMNFDKLSQKKNLLLLREYVAKKYSKQNKNFN